VTQSERLLAFLRLNPGASSLEITVALRLVNVTGRISDLRAEGYVIDAWRATDRVWRYRVVEAPVQLGAFG
jgi:hypothetical protein